MRLAILGASARAAAFSALDAGYQVVAADLFADADLAARCGATRISDWPSGFIDWLSEQSVDAWLYTGGLENHPELVGQLASLRPLMGCNCESLQQTRSVKMLAGVFAVHGVHFAPVRFSPPNQNASGKAWLLKSQCSAGGLGVRDWIGDAAAAADDYWQQRIDGVSISAAYVAAGGVATLLGVTEQLIGRPWTGASSYQYAGSVGPFEIANRTQSQIELAGAVVASECGVAGLFGVDFVLDAEDVAWAVEVNPRYTASMEVVEQITGVSAVEVHVAACTAGGFAPLAHATNGGYCGKSYLFAKSDLQAAALTADNIADIPTPGETFGRGDPVCTLFANASEYGDVEAVLQHRCETIEQQFLSCLPKRG